MTVTLDYHYLQVVKKEMAVSQSKYHLFHAQAKLYSLWWVLQWQASNDHNNYSDVTITKIW